MGEGVKKACLRIDVPRQVGDADVRHQSVDGAIEAFASGRRD